MIWGGMPVGAYFFPTQPVEDMVLCHDGVYRSRKSLEGGILGAKPEETTLGADSTEPDDASRG